MTVAHVPSLTGRVDGAAFARAPALANPYSPDDIPTLKVVTVNGDLTSGTVGATMRLGENGPYEYVSGTWHCKAP